MPDLRKTLRGPPKLTEMKWLRENSAPGHLITYSRYLYVANACLLTTFPKRHLLQWINRVYKDSERRVAWHEQWLLVQATIRLCWNSRGLLTHSHASVFTLTITDSWESHILLPHPSRTSRVSYLCPNRTWPVVWSYIYALVHVCSSLFHVWPIPYWILIHKHSPFPPPGSEKCFLSLFCLF